MVILRQEKGCTLCILLTKCYTTLDKPVETLLGHLAPVVQRPDNFILWISHYPTVSICAKISVFPLVQANMYTLTTVNLGSVRKPWTSEVYFRP